MPLRSRSCHLTRRAFSLPLFLSLSLSLCCARCSQVMALADALAHNPALARLRLTEICSSVANYDNDARAAVKEKMRLSHPNLRLEL